MPTRTPLVAASAEVLVDDGAGAAEADVAVVGDQLEAGRREVERDLSLHHALVAPEPDEASRATTRSVAGPSLMPFTLASETLSFFSATGTSNFSEARTVSVPPEESVTANDLRPLPASSSVISSGAAPIASASGTTLICGGCDSKRGRR